MEEPVTETGIVSGEDRALGDGCAEFLAINHPKSNGERWVRLRSRVRGDIQVGEMH